MKRPLRLGILCLALASCGSPMKLVGRPELGVVPASQLPEPDLGDLVPPSRPFLIGPYDQLAIDVFGVSELTRTVQVDSSGRVALPLAGVIEAAGKTPGEVSALIAERLRGRFVKNPQVAVNVTETVSQTITIDGAVSKPGSYPVAGQTTLMRAIAKAEGTTQFARENYVVVFRQVNNKQMAALHDLRAIRQGAYPDPNIFPNDVVLVGDSPAKRLFRDVIQFAPVLVAPIIQILGQ